MTIRELVRRAADGKAGTAGAWRTSMWTDGTGRKTATLHHYSTAMLRWDVAQPSNPDVLDYSTGWGSVSDQGGMNTAFRVLGLPLYFSRAGGASIEDTSERLSTAGFRAVPGGFERVAA